MEWGAEVGVLADAMGWDTAGLELALEGASTWVIPDG